MAKKIMLFVLSILLIISFLYLTLFTSVFIYRVVVTGKSILHHAWGVSFLEFLFIVMMYIWVLYAIFVTVLFAKSNYLCRYTYEEYKAKMDAKKAEIKEKKLQSKRERLRKELEEMEKAE